MCGTLHNHARQRIKRLRSQPRLLPTGFGSGWLDAALSNIALYYSARHTALRSSLECGPLDGSPWSTGSEFVRTPKSTMTDGNTTSRRGRTCIRMRSRVRSVGGSMVAIALPPVVGEPGHSEIHPEIHPCADEIPAKRRYSKSVSNAQQADPTGRQTTEGETV